jgi:hypothetical protein
MPEILAEYSNKCKEITVSNNASHLLAFLFSGLEKNIVKEKFPGLLLKE